MKTLPHFINVEHNLEFTILSINTAPLPTHCLHAHVMRWICRQKPSFSHHLILYYGQSNASHSSSPKQCWSSRYDLLRQRRGDSQRLLGFRPHWLTHVCVSVKCATKNQTIARNRLTIDDWKLDIWMSRRRHYIYFYRDHTMDARSDGPKDCCRLYIPFSVIRSLR